MPENPHIRSSLAVNGWADLLVSLNVADLAPAARLYRFRLATPGEALRAMRHLGV